MSLEEAPAFHRRIARESEIRLVPSRDRRRETDWIKQNRARYANQWVVVEGDRLIAADPDGHKAFAAAEEAGVEVPFLVHVLPEDPLAFLMGWHVPVAQSPLRR